MAQMLSLRSEVFALHLAVSLFHAAPGDLPEDVRQHLSGWLKAAPAATELYVRQGSGVLHVTLTVSGGPSKEPWHILEVL